MTTREMAVGNTFGATALSSYGGFWIAYALLLTPSPWAIMEESGPYMGNTNSPVGFFLTGWFIFTTILLICTLRSTVAFFLLFFTLDLAFLFLSVEHYAADMGNEAAALGLKKAGGFFGFLAAFLAWYNALAGIQDSRYVPTSYRRWKCLMFLAATPSSPSPLFTSPGLTRARRCVPRRPTLSKSSHEIRLRGSLDFAIMRVLKTSRMFSWVVRSLCAVSWAQDTLLCCYIPGCPRVGLNVLTIFFTRQFSLLSDSDSSPSVIYVARTHVAIGF